MDEIAGVLFVTGGVFAAGLVGNWGWEPYGIAGALVLALFGFLLPARCRHDR